MLLTLQGRASIGLLNPLKLGQVSGSFKPLTAPAQKKAWYKRSAGPTMPMTGVHITLEGKGIHWAQAEVDD